MISAIPRLNAKISVAQTKLELDDAIMEAQDDFQQEMGNEE